MRGQDLLQAEGRFKRQEFEKEGSEAGPTTCARANIASVVEEASLSPKENPCHTGVIVHAGTAQHPA